MDSNTLANPSTIGLVAGRYRLAREIARGGMGVVHEARHLETGRVVAIKLIPPRAREDERVEARLRREARALGMLNHPGIVQVLDAGVCNEHGFFLAMEMLDGRTLDSLLVARTKLAIENALWVAKAAASALEHAHARGVVHRDVKPANLLVTSNPLGADRVVLIDFGLSGYDGDVTPPSAKLTGPGELLGTLEYIAPEQLSNAGGRETRSDQYSLALVLHECLAGELPTLANRVATPPRLPDLTAARPGVSAAVADAVNRALSTKPESRFANVAEFLAALEAAAPIKPVSLLQSTARAEAKDRDTPTRVDLHKVAAEAAVGRRRHPRAPYITPCRILFASGAHIDGRSEDISAGGLLVMLSAADPKASPPAAHAKAQEAVQVRFSLPTTGAVVTVPGNVRWVVDGRGRSALGIEFVDPEASVTSAISLYVGIVGQPQTTVL